MTKINDIYSRLWAGASLHGQARWGHAVKRRVERVFYILDSPIGQREPRISNRSAERRLTTKPDISGRPVLPVTVFNSLIPCAETILVVRRVLPPCVLHHLTPLVHLFPLIMRHFRFDHIRHLGERHPEFPTDTSPWFLAPAAVVGGVKIASDIRL
jgi:hypothetical protein